MWLTTTWKSRTKESFHIFQQYSGPVTTLTPEGFPETGLFMHLSHHVFRIKQFQKYLSYGAYVFSEICKN